MNKLKMSLGIAGIALIAQTSFAQTKAKSLEEGGHVGGGNWTEAKIKNRMMDLIPYLYSREGKKDFPIIEKYDSEHPEETFAEVIQNTAPVLWNGPKQEKFDGERDCEAHVEKGNRYFKCNANALPDYDQNAPRNDDIEGDYNRFWFHEALVQADLETARNETVRSTYTYSSTLAYHLETFQKLMPGKGKTPKKVEMLSDTGIFCSDHSEEFNKQTLIFIWKPSGDYVLIKEKLPEFQAYYGLMQYQITNKKEENRFNRKQKIRHAISGDVTHTVLARGNNMRFLERSSGRFSLAYSTLMSKGNPESSGATNTDFGFMVQTPSYLDETPASSGRGTEIPLHFMTGMKHYHDATMYCSELYNTKYTRNVPVQEIFENKNQTVFKKNYIKTVHNRHFDR